MYVFARPREVAAPLDAASKAAVVPTRRPLASPVLTHSIASLPIQRVSQLWGWTTANVKTAAAAEFQTACNDMDAALRVLGWQAGQATMMRTLTATTDLAAPAPVVAAPVVAAPAVAVPAVAAPPPQYATHVTLVWSDVENSIEHSLQSNVQHSLTAARKKLRLIDFHVTVEQHGQADVRNPRWFSNTGHWINLPAHGAAPTQADAVIADGRAIMAALGN